jgi:small-conductance mechanosensitive channel
MVQPTGRKLRALLAGVLSIVFLGSLAFAWLTRDAMLELPRTRRDTIVDTYPWQTSEALASLAVSAEEVRLAREAQRLADHEVDQTFAAALREATLHRPVITGEALEISRKMKTLQDTIAADRARIKELTARDPFNDLEIAKAQLELDTDQLSEAQEDLARAANDDRTRIQRELTARETAMAKFDAKAAAPLGNTALTVSENRDSVAASVKAWLAERNRLRLLRNAALQSELVATSFSIQHQRLKKRLDAAPESADKAERLAVLKNQTTYAQLLGIYDDRIATLHQLAAVYTKWADQVRLQQRMTSHLLARSLALMAFIVICVLALHTLVARMTTHPTLDGRRAQTLSTILKLTVQFVGIIFLLLVFFGTPNQMPTIVGLTTAGLTVVLQDFIISFVGWFALVGRNGIRIGDWVEINGVPGEVLNVSLFRTTLLETGSSSEKGRHTGRPTGRTITLLNSFAIKGQYFNYSTSGQWMWDEIRIAVPPDRDVHSVLEQVRIAVTRETAKNFQLAASEWSRLQRHFTAEPAVDMRPGPSGVDLVVRYVTRAAERFDLRNRLYQCLLDLLRGTGKTGNTTLHTE